MNKVVVITGPTGVGKTAISIDVAKSFNTDIINCDASQFKRGLNIGTAKITEDEKCGVYHHLLDQLDILDEYSVKDYQDDARRIINDLIKQNRLPLMVGGTGLYISATLFDYHFDNDNQYHHDSYDEYSNDELYEMLVKCDYESSKVIHKNNRRRVIRAIEISKNSNNLLSDNKSGSDPLYDALIIVLDCPRNQLYNRINMRFDKMINDGWIDECISLKNQGIDLSKIKDIGYKEISEYLDGNLTFDQMKEAIQKATRHYAKRQLTWFRNKFNATFVNVDYNNMNYTSNEIISLIDDFLKKE